MNKTLHSLLLLAATTSFAASELTTADEPETEINKEMAATLKSAGLAASFKISKRVFLRDGVKVAALLTTTTVIGDKPPEIGKFVQFYIDADNWLEINLADTQLFTSHFASEAIVSATGDSITVTAPKKGYCEIFFKSNGTFMDGAPRERMAPGRLSGHMLAR